MLPKHEHMKLSERDSLRVLALIEYPPAPPARLARAAKAYFRLPEDVESITPRFGAEFLNSATRT